MNPNTPESNALLVESLKQDKIDYLVKNGFKLSDLESRSLPDLKKMANAILMDNYQMEMSKVGGKSKRKHSRGKRKHSRRHKTRRHSKK
jgi:hypothetical protein